MVALLIKWIYQVERTISVSDDRSA